MLDSLERIYMYEIHRACQWGYWRFVPRLPSPVSADPSRSAASCRINRRPRPVRNGGRTSSSGRTLALGAASAASSRFLRWLQARADSGTLSQAPPRVEDAISPRSDVQMRVTERRQPQANGSCFSPAGATYLCWATKGAFHALSLQPPKSGRAARTHGQWPGRLLPSSVVRAQVRRVWATGDGPLSPKSPESLGWGDAWGMLGLCWRTHTGAPAHHKAAASGPTTRTPAHQLLRCPLSRRGHGAQAAGPVW